MSDFWQDLEEIFNVVCVLDEDQRAAALDARCGGDARLRAEAERLVRAYDEERAAHAQACGAAAGRRFGAWQTVRLLGRGGMGEVWLAERADGQHEQQAALKLLSPYLAAADSLKRFRRERQLLARLEHPNISRLLDGGMSPQGEPYLVMEYVEGTPLDSYCLEHKLSIRERLELMTKVCTAVSFAHQYLVVHRDLKPGNILVTKDGEPKLLDFGIAKVLDSEAALERTVTSTLFLTPAYAAPEILRGSPATVASDVYSLGVVLYELLIGRRPFDAAKLGPAGLVQAVTEVDAPAPGMGRDLDAIMLKALARNPEERYGSAAQFAEDIRRYLDGLPVSAVVRSRWYVAKKFVRRNRLAVGAAAVLLVSLAAGLAGTLWEARAAEQRFNDARRLANYLLFDLYDAVDKLPGAMPVQAAMARRALEYLDRMAAGKTNDPALRLELAQGYLKLGEVWGHRLGVSDTLGDTARAIDSDRKAIAILEPLVRAHPKMAEARRALATGQEMLGAALNGEGRYEDAARSLRQAAGTFEQDAVAHPRDVRSLQDAGTAWYTFGKQLSEKGAYISFDAGVPLSYLHKAVNELNAALQLSPANPAIVKLLVMTWESVGRIDSTPNPALGITDFTNALNLIAKLPAAEQQQPEARDMRAMMLVHIGWDKGQLKDLKGALADLDEARPVLDSLAAADPQNAGTAYQRMDLYRSLGLIHGYAGHQAASLANLRQAIEILDWTVARDPANKTYPLLRAELQHRVANLLVAAHRGAEAQRYAESSVAYFRQIGESPNATPAQLMEAVRCLAETAVKPLRDYHAALAYALRADRLAKGKNPAVLGYLAETYSLLGDPANALASARRGLAILPPVKPGEARSQLRQWLEDQQKEYGGQ